MIGDAADGISWAAGPDRGGDPDRPARAGATVLIVDDDPSLRLALGPVLETAGLSVTTAATLAEAESALRGRGFDLVITDLCLQGSDGRQGFDVIAHARAASAATIIVLFTAFGGPQVRSEALRLGALDLWEKSMPIREMVRRVRALRLGAAVPPAGPGPPPGASRAPAAS